jgi:hypothetical protein
MSRPLDFSILTPGFFRKEPARADLRVSFCFLSILETRLPSLESAGTAREESQIYTYCRLRRQVETSRRNDVPRCYEAIRAQLTTYPFLLSAHRTGGSVNLFSVAPYHVLLVSNFCVLSHDFCAAVSLLVVEFFQAL